MTEFSDGGFDDESFEDEVYADPVDNSGELDDYHDEPYESESDDTDDTSDDDYEEDDPDRPSETPETAAEKIRRLGLPTWEKPLRLHDPKDMGPAIEGLVGRLVQDHAEQTAMSGFKVPRVQLPSPKFGPGEAVGTPAEQRTPGKKLISVSNSKPLGDFDASFHSGTKLRPETKQRAVESVLRYYDVDPRTVSSYAGRSFKFVHKGNAVRMSVSAGYVDIIATDARLTPHEQETVEEVDSRLQKAGSSIAQFHRYLETGRLTPMIRGMEDIITSNADEVRAEFAQHEARVRGLHVQNGFRKFQIWSPATLRLAVPLALHLVEQPPEQAYQILGPYSATHGFIETQQPGALYPAVHPRARATTPQPTELWGLTRRGNIIQVR